MHQDEIRYILNEFKKVAAACQEKYGVKLGRPAGRGVKVDKAIEAAGMKVEDITRLKESGVSVAAIARIIGADRRTVTAWLKRGE